MFLLGPATCSAVHYMASCALACFLILLPGSQPHLRNHWRHSLLLRCPCRPPQLPGQPAALGPVPMSCSSQSHLAIMHRQDRNNAGSIFGGHLLRLAAELAYSTAVLHAGRHCEAVAMGDVAFKQPVPIGCVLEMRAKVGQQQQPACCVLAGFPTICFELHKGLLRSCMLLNVCRCGQAGVPHMMAACWRCAPRFAVGDCCRCCCLLCCG